MIIDFFILIILIIFWFLLVEIGTILLRQTELSDEIARFQAISALTGTGFTTQESEAVVTNQRRRKVITALMILGYIVWGTGVALIVSNLRTDLELVWRLLYLAGFALIIFIAYRLLTHYKRLTYRLRKFLERVVLARLRRRHVVVSQVVSLKEGYTIAEVVLAETFSGSGETLARLALNKENILLLAIERHDGEIITTPGGQHRLLPGDKLYCYGATDSLKAYFG